MLHSFIKSNFSSLCILLVFLYCLFFPSPYFPSYPVTPTLSSFFGHWRNYFLCSCRQNLVPSNNVLLGKKEGVCMSENGKRVLLSNILLHITYFLLFFILRFLYFATWGLLNWFFKLVSKNLFLATILVEHNSTSVLQFYNLQISNKKT